MFLSVHPIFVTRTLVPAVPIMTTGAAFGEGGSAGRGEDNPVGRIGSRMKLLILAQCPLPSLPPSTAPGAFPFSSWLSFREGILPPIPRSHVVTFPTRFLLASVAGERRRENWAECKRRGQRPGRGFPRLHPVTESCVLLLLVLSCTFPWPSTWAPSPSFSLLFYRHAVLSTLNNLCVLWYLSSRHFCI